MRAEVALLSRVRVRIDVQRVVRTRLHAGFAADAAIAVEVHDAVIAAEQRGHWADGDARRVVAVIAAEHREEASRVWILALLDVLDPGSKGAERDFVFGFAGDRAGVTSDALAVVDDEAVFHLRSITG